MMGSSRLNERRIKGHICPVSIISRAVANGRFFFPLPSFSFVLSLLSEEYSGGREIDGTYDDLPKGGEGERKKEACHGSSRLAMF